LPGTAARFCKKVGLVSEEIERPITMGAVITVWMRDADREGDLSSRKAGKWIIKAREEK